MREEKKGPHEFSKSKPKKKKLCVFERDKKETLDASAGNRTRGPSMATTDFTTKPPMPVCDVEISSFLIIKVNCREQNGFARLGSPIPRFRDSRVDPFATPGNGLKLVGMLNSLILIWAG